MKVSCEIIQDLLPLYHDGVCSNDSKILIEEHLTHCANCKRDLMAMENEFSIATTEQNLLGAEVVKKLSQEWKKGMRKSLFKGVLITTVVLLILYTFIGFKFLPKPL